MPFSIFDRFRLSLPLPPFSPLPIAFAFAVSFSLRFLHCAELSLTLLIR
jgi:hypothetical protein